MTILITYNRQKHVMYLYKIFVKVKYLFPNYLQSWFSPQRNLWPTAPKCDNKISLFNICLAEQGPSSRAVNANQFAKLLVFNPPNWPLPLPEQWPLENTIHGVMDSRPGCWPLIGGGRVWWPDTGPWLEQSGGSPRRHCWWQVATSVLMEAGNGNKKWNYILAPQHSDISSVLCFITSTKIW